MKPNLRISLLIFFLCPLISDGQEVKKKKTNSPSYREEYFVLKEDKSIKHGQYIKYERIPTTNRAIPVELGSFENNLKDGTWYICYPKGSLKMIGTYVKGEKNGLWKEFFKNSYDVIGGISASLGFRGSINIDDQNVANVNISGLIVSAEGSYFRGKKSGMWNYYSQAGILIQKYDHSNKILSLNALGDSLTSKCPYLGGVERFNNLFWTTYFETGIHPGTNSKVSFGIQTKDSTITFERLESSGDKSFAPSIKATLEQLTNDWIISVIEQSEITMSFVLKKDNGNWYSLEFD